MLRPAWFLDRDGTLIDETGYLRDPDQVRLLPGAAQAVRRLNREGFAVVVVTNQAGIAYGYFDEAQLEESHARLAALLAEQGAAIDALYYCPHHPEGVVAAYRRPCDCRKPAPGMLLRAVREHGLDLAASYMVGDRLSDILAGRSAGCRTALVRTGYGLAEEARIDGEAGPDLVADDLLDAVRAMLSPRSRT